MKKKIGDLTLREIKREQDKVCNIKFECSKCPFRHCCVSETLDLDQEIEVKEYD